MTEAATKGIDEKILRPILHTSWPFYATLIVLAGIIGWSLYAWWTQLTQGLGVTGLRDWGVRAGAPWGIYIASFIWYGGIAYGSIAVSAAIRIMKLEQYRRVARIAEVLAIVTLMMAGINIVFDIGRPDRIFNMVLNYWERVGYSPLIWDLTVLIGYFVLSVTYLVITMREDLVTTYDKVPKRLRPFYRIFLVGYNPGERVKVEQMAWWLALSLIALTTLLSGGVAPWLFGLLSAQPGWFGAIQGPSFLIAALTSAVASVILVAAIVRHIFGWQNEIPAELFKGLSKILAVLTLIYLWLVLQEQITIQYGGPLPERMTSEALLTGRFAPLFWSVIGALILTFIYLALQASRPSLFNVKGVTLASLVIMAVLWVKRFLIVVPPLLYTRLPYPVGVYQPTWVEWSLLAGTVAMATLLYMLFTKIYPLMELRKEVR